MSLPVQWRPAAQADLFALYRWIAGQAGAATAFDYTAAIEAHVAKLADLPGWGAPREELGRGIRTISYRGRTSIAYRILDHCVEVVALAHGGRDLGRMFADEER